VNKGPLTISCFIACQGGGQRSADKATNHPLTTLYSNIKSDGITIRVIKQDWSTIWLHSSGHSVQWGHWGIVGVITNRGGGWGELGAVVNLDHDTILTTRYKINISRGKCSLQKPYVMLSKL